VRRLWLTVAVAVALSLMSAPPAQAEPSDAGATQTQSARRECFDDQRGCTRQQVKEYVRKFRRGAFGRFRKSQRLEYPGVFRTKVRRKWNKTHRTNFPGYKKVTDHDNCVRIIVAGDPRGRGYCTNDPYKDSWLHVTIKEVFKCGAGIALTYVSMRKGKGGKKKMTKREIGAAGINCYWLGG
jgi:hypothetical protein